MHMLWALLALQSWQGDPVRFISTIFLTPEHLDTVGRLFQEHVNYLCIKQKQYPCQFSMWFLKCKLKGWRWAAEASWWMQRYLKETSLSSNPNTVILATSLCSPEGYIEHGKAILDLSPSIPQWFGLFTSRKFWHIAGLQRNIEVFREIQTHGYMGKELLHPTAVLHYYPCFSALDESFYSLVVYLSWLTYPTSPTILHVTQLFGASSLKVGKTSHIDLLRKHTTRLQ